MKFKILKDLIFKYNIEYFFFVIIVFLINENTLERIDQTPPLSDKSIFISRIISYFIILFFLTYKILFSEKFVNFCKKLIVTIIFFVLIDIFFSIIGFGNFYIQDEYLKRRYPSPYDMFAPQPNIRAHNSLGFKGEEFKYINNSQILKIGFFAGSTGYNGAPPIANRVQDLLRLDGINNFVYNFSSTSSNHTQHKHRLLKYLDYDFDLIIFYGGGNETEGYYFYDPRPGYPHSYYFKSFSELNPFKAYLIRYSSFFGEIENRTGLLTGLNELKKIKQDFQNWSDQVSNQYEKDINHSKIISFNTNSKNYCRESKFMAVFQPLDFKDDKQILMVNKIKKKMKFYDFFYDYSDLKEKVVFTDRIHVDNDSKQIIAERLTADIKKIIGKCKD